MPVTAALIGGGASLLGGFLGGNSQKKAAQISANAQLEAARIAADAARFRPVGVTTRFGQSQFQFDPSGNLTGAGYQIDPRLAAYQERLDTLAGQRLSEAEMAPQAYAPLQRAGQQLFQLGGQYLAETPEQVAERYMARQMDLLAPSRERQYAQLQNQLFQTGRGGLSVGGTGARPSGSPGLAAANPELEAYYNALAQQDAQLAAQAQQEGQRQLAFGTGLFGQGAGLLGGYESGVAGALNPFTTAIGGISTLESLGQQPLDIGAQLGGRAATAGANVGQSLLQGGLSAARTTQAANFDPMSAALMGFGSNPALTSGAANLFGRQLTPADYSNLASWQASQREYAPYTPQYYQTPSVWGELGP
jgi:hypothetical protein